MKELQILDVVRIGKEAGNGGDSYYVELLEKFDWLLEDEFQNLIKGFEWESLIASKPISDSKEPKSMHRSYPGSDIWAAGSKVMCIKLKAIFPTVIRSRSKRE